MNEEILKRLDVVAAKLGIAASHLWTVLVRQQWISGIDNLAWGIVQVVFAVFALRVAFRWIRIFQDDDLPGKQLPSLIGTIILTVSGIAAVLFGLYNLSCSYPLMLNPEFYAFQSLLKILEGK